MDINRNQWFLAGLVLLMLGIQFRMVDSVVFTPEFTELLSEQSGHTVASVGGPGTLLDSAKPVIKKTYRPPEWIGWALLSAGATLILHSLAMKKPGG
jgi:hypothetical protein